MHLNASLTDRCCGLQTAEALYARDESTEEDACVKKMQHWEQFEAEVLGRSTRHGKALPRDAVISVLRWQTPPGVTLTNPQGQREEPQHTAPDKTHQFVLVMARGQCSLHDACVKGECTQQSLSGFACSIVLCTKDLHESGVVHAELKQR